MKTSIDQINKQFELVIGQEAAEICQNYVPDEKTLIFAEGPRYSTMGYTNISKEWRDFCDCGIKVEKFEWLEGPFTEESDDFAWVAGIVLVRYSVKGQLMQKKFRTTYVLKKNEANQWKIRHEHVSFPVDDPIGIGDWLKPDES